MVWGDVWVSNAKTRPELDVDRPKRDWIKAGLLTNDERAFIDAVKRLSGTRDAQPRAVDLFIHLYATQVGADRETSKNAALTFAPAGLWVAVDLTPDHDEENPRFVYFTQRVHAAKIERETPKIAKSETKRPHTIVSVRGHAPSRKSPLEWVK